MASDKIEAGMTYSQALNILGFKTRPSSEQLKRRFKKLARLYHPDINKTINAAENFKRINDARTRVQMGDKKAYLIDWKKYYKLLASKIPEDGSLALAQQVFAREVRKPMFRKNKEEEEKLAASLKRIQEQIQNREQFEEYSRMKSRSKLRSLARRAALDEETRDINRLQEQARAIIFKNSVEYMLSKIPKLLQRAVRIKKIPYVPIIVKPKDKKPYIKYILLTTSLIIAILGGKYGWDNLRNAYYKNKRTLVVRR